MLNINKSHLIKAAVAVGLGVLSLPAVSRADTTDGMQGDGHDGWRMMREPAPFQFSATEQTALNPTLDSMPLAQQVRFLEFMRSTTPEERHFVIDGLGQGATVVSDDTTGHDFVLRTADGNIHLLFTQVHRYHLPMHKSMMWHHRWDNCAGAGIKYDMAHNDFDGTLNGLSPHPHQRDWDDHMGMYNRPDVDVQIERAHHMDMDHHNMDGHDGDGADSPYPYPTPNM